LHRALQVNTKRFVGFFLWMRSITEPSSTVIFPLPRYCSYSTRPHLPRLLSGPPFFFMTGLATPFFLFNGRLRRTQFCLCAALALSALRRDCECFFLYPPLLCLAASFSPQFFPKAPAFYSFCNRSPLTLKSFSSPLPSPSEFPPPSLCFSLTDPRCCGLLLWRPLWNLVPLPKPNVSLPRQEEGDFFTLRWPVCAGEQPRAGRLDSPRTSPPPTLPPPPPPPPRPPKLETTPYPKPQPPKLAGIQIPKSGFTSLLPFFLQS